MTLILKQENNMQMRQSGAASAVDVAAQIIDPACAGKTDLFFSESTRDMRKAQTICSGCNIKDQCLDVARSNPPFAGVWGGVIFVNGEELLTKRGRGRPAKSEQLDNARVLKALGIESNAEEDDEAENSGSNQELVRQIA